MIFGFTFRKMEIVLLSCHYLIDQFYSSFLKLCCSFQQGIDFYFTARIIYASI